MADPSITFENRDTHSVCIPWAMSFRRQLHKVWKIIKQWTFTVQSSDYEGYEL